MDLKDFIEKVGEDVSTSGLIEIVKEVEDLGSISIEKITKKVVEEIKSHLVKLDELTKENNDKLNSITLNLLHSIETIKSLKADGEAIKNQIGDFNSEAQKIVDKMQNDFIANLDSSVQGIKTKNESQDETIKIVSESVKQNVYDDVQRANKQAAIDAQQDIKMLSLSEKIDLKLKSFESRLEFLEEAPSEWDDEELILNKKIMDVQKELKTLKNELLFLGIVLTAVVGIITYHLIF